MQESYLSPPDGHSYKLRFDYFISDESRGSHPVVWAAEDSLFAHDHATESYDAGFLSIKLARGIYISNSTMCISNQAISTSAKLIDNVNISNSSVGDYAQAC